MAITNPTIGQIVLFGGNFAPRNWAYCNGQLLAISSYTALFSIIGTTYGGDGRTTFGLPDLQTRIPKGIGNGPGIGNTNIGQKGGALDVAILVQNMASHSHPHSHTATVHAESRIANKAAPGNNRFALSGANIYHDDDGTAPDTTMHANTVTVASGGTATGGNQPINIENPFLGVNYIIALQGTFPSRN